MILNLYENIAFQDLKMQILFYSKKLGLYFIQAQLNGPFKKLKGYHIIGQ